MGGYIALHTVRKHMYEFYCDNVLVGYVRYSYLLHVFEAGRTDLDGKAKIFKSFNSLESALKWTRWW